jgi:hypothetical protein
MYSYPDYFVDLLWKISYSNQVKQKSLHFWCNRAGIFFSWYFSRSGITFVQSIKCTYSCVLNRVKEKSGRLSGNCNAYRIKGEGYVEFICK